MELSMTITGMPALAAALVAGTSPLGSLGFRIRTSMLLDRRSSTSANCLFMSSWAAVAITALTPISAAFFFTALVWAAKYGAARVYMERPMVISLGQVS